MNIKTMTAIINDIKPGVFTRLVYTTELPLKAEYKKQGYKVVKTCEMTTRFGIHYGNIKEVKERNESYSKETRKNDNIEWVVKNIIQYNKEKDSYYLCTYPTKKGRNTSATYNIFTPNGNFYKVKDFDKNLVIDSYWNKKVTNMMKININNVLKIGGKY